MVNVFLICGDGIAEKRRKKATMKIAEENVGARLMNSYRCQLHQTPKKLTTETIEMRLVTNTSRRRCLAF